MQICTSRRFALSAVLSATVLIGQAPRRPVHVAHSAGHVPPHLRGCGGNAPSGSTTRVIGPAGGAIRFGDHVLEIPAGALDSAVSITATAPQSQYLTVDLAPHGLRFVVPARLSMGYGACAWADSVFHIDYLSDDLTQVLEQEPSTVHANRHTVEASIDHFSVYAIAESDFNLRLDAPATAH